MDTESDREPTTGSPSTRALADQPGGTGSDQPADHAHVADADPSTHPGAGHDAPSTPDGAPDVDADAESSQLIARQTRMVPIGTFVVPGVVRPIPQPDGWTDVLTGTDGPRLWDRIILSEQARAARYHRPVTVAFAEIVGLDSLASQWGWDVSERALAACARRLGREIRSSDHIARLEQARFGILLTETAEIAAINFVERARASCERELATVGTDVAIGFGWASPPEGGDLSDAVQLALTRLAAELAS
ncbi:MAG TPA: diguanylate cyclase [Candidatus Deferrimicrobium sp.]|nr:diguanylate cyclase [Candidatus Deferrimicrobium sp.]